MKKNFILLAVCILGMTSCLGGSSYEMTDSPVISFDFQESEGEIDSLFLGVSPMTYSSYFGFYNAAESSETDDSEVSEFMGGFAYSKRLVRWNLSDAETEQAAAPADGSEEAKYMNDNLYMTVFQQLDKFQPVENAYAVFYQPHMMSPEKHHITFLASNVGEWTPKYCLIANNAYTVARATGYDISAYPQTSVSYPPYEFKRYQPAVVGTDGEVVTPAVDGDYIRVVAKGYTDGASQETGKAEIYLVDYIDGQSDTVMTAWKMFDLSKLGTVNYVDFEVECSDALKNSDYLIYFCLDNFTSSVHIKY